VTSWGRAAADAADAAGAVTDAGHVGPGGSADAVVAAVDTWPVTPVTNPERATHTTTAALRRFIEPASSSSPLPAAGAFCRTRRIGCEFTLCPCADPNAR
jgi:hypothetical protein